jgi:phage recombination protein Bet
MSTALQVVREEREQPIMGQWTREDLDALKATVAKNCNAAQFKVFLGACKRLNLDPFARQIVPIVQGDSMTPQVTIDGFRLIADRTGKYVGQVGPQWCGPDGQWHDVWLTNTAPVACKVGVLRSDFREVMWGVARTGAYHKGGNWNGMPDVMIAKVAESLALRRAFPNDLSGVYTEDEMGVVEADNEPAAAKVVEERPQPAPRSPLRPAPKPSANGFAQFLNDIKALGITPPAAMDRLGVKTLAGLDYPSALAVLRCDPEETDLHNLDMPAVKP